MPSHSSYTDKNAATIDTYERFADVWVAAHAPPTPPSHQEPIKRFLERVNAPGALIFEVGSGPGYTADFIKRMNYNVLASDAAGAFVRLMVSRGLPAIRQNIVTEPTPGQYRGIWAGAVFHHMSGLQMDTAIGNVYRGLTQGGWFGLTVRHGYNEPYWDETLGGSRYYNPKSQLTLMVKLANAGFKNIEHGEFTDERNKKWTWAIAQRPVKR